MPSIHRHFCAVALFALVTCNMSAQSETASAKTMSPAERTHVVEGYGKLPLSFEANQGQTDAQVKFLSRGDGYSLSLTASEAVLSLPGRTCNGPLQTNALKTKLAMSGPCTAIPSSTVRLSLLGSNREAEIAGQDELPGKSNYFVGRDPAAWHTEINNYRKVQYRDVYPGINLVYYGNQRQLEHDFIVAPGADPKAIRLSLTGAQSVTLDPDGNLVLGTHAGKLLLKRPALYQMVAGVRKSVAGSYVRGSSNEIGFAIGAYDRNKELVIDPVLAYSTYFSGAFGNYLFGLAVDATGGTYVVGTDANGQVLVSKLNEDGSALIYSTELGSAYPSGIAVDAAGSAYVTGEVDSNNFPTVNAYQSKLSGTSAAFVTKLSPSGTKLEYSTFFGGDYGRGDAIAVDTAGSAYVVGYSGPRLPVVTAITTGTGPYVAKFSPTGSSLIYSTYITGSSDNDLVYGIAVDPAGEAILTGAAESPDFPIVHGLYPTCIGRESATCDDVYVTKVNAAGNSLVYSTFLGAGSGMSVATNASGDAFVTGYAFKQGFPVVNALYPSTNLRGAAFVTRLNPAGSALVYSTFLGGSVDDTGDSIAVDQYSNAYVGGYTTNNFPIVDAVQPHFAGGMRDAFISKLNASGSALLYSTYLGGSDDEAMQALGIDFSGNVYVTGATLSHDFPTKNPLQAQADPDSAGYNSFISKISDSSRRFSIANAVDHSVTGPGGDLRYTVTITNNGAVAPAAMLNVHGVRESLVGCVVSNGDKCTVSDHRFDAAVDFSPFASGETRTISIHAKAAKTAGDYNSITNAALLTSGAPAYETDSAAAPVTVRETADMAVSSALVDSRNGLLHYVHTVTNIGPNNAHAALLVAGVPANTTFVSASTTAGSCTFYQHVGNPGEARCTLNNPAAGSPIQVDVFVKASAASCPKVTSTATITSLSIDPDAANDSSTITTTLPSSVCKAVASTK